MLALAALALAAVAQPACNGETDATDDDDDDGSSGAGGTTSPMGGNGGGAEGGGGSGQQMFCLDGGYSTVPGGGACDVFAQNCPEGTGCEPIESATTTACVPDTGVKGPGDPCNSDDSCRAGLWCVNFFCSPVCCPGTNEPCGDSPCNVNTQVGGGKTVLTCGYFPSCDLFTGSCIGGTACYPLYGEGRSVCVNQLGNKGDGELCGAINECADSMGCVGNPGTCRWACLLDNSNSTPGQGGCPAGQTCQAVGSNPPAGIGSCNP